MTKISYLVLTFLANAVWQVSLIAAIAMCGARLLRHAPAGYRHGLLAAALLLSFALPLASLYGPGRDRPVVVERAPAAGTQMRADLPTPVRQPASPATAGRPSIFVGDLLALTIVGLYALFLLYRAVGLWRAWRMTVAIRRAASPAALPARLEAAVKKYLAVLNVGRSELRVTRSASGPLTVGVLRPVIILPEQLLAEAPDDHLAAALGHELAHIRRRDFACNLVYELLSLPLSFHPAAILLKRGLARTRELACDELVCERLMDARAYARSLVGLAKSLSSPQPVTYAVGINDADILEERVMRLVNRSGLRGNRSGKTLALVAITLLCATGVVAASVSLRVSGSERQQSDSAGRSEGAAGADERSPSAGSLLKGAMELNRAGRWREAAQLAEAVIRKPGASLAERCEAYASSAYSYDLLKETDNALGAVKQFDEQCGDIPATTWQRQEVRRVGNNLNGIPPATATDLNRAGEWSKAAEVAEGVISGGNATLGGRCAARVDAAFAYVRLKKRDAAAGQLKQFEEECGDLPADGWQRSEVQHLKAEIE